MINAIQTIDCDTCYGRGLVFIGDDNDYNVEPCECIQWQVIQQSNYAERRGLLNMEVLRGITTQQNNKETRCQMKLTITSMNVKTHDMDLPTKENVYYFIDMYKKNLKRNQRVKITCDVLSIDGYLQGTAALR